MLMRSGKTTDVQLSEKILYSLDLVSTAGAGKSKLVQKRGGFGKLEADDDRLRHPSVKQRCSETYFSFQTKVWAVLFGPANNIYTSKDPRVLKDFR